jgi:hypothetical protein
MVIGRAGIVAAALAAVGVACGCDSPHAEHSEPEHRHGSRPGPPVADDIAIPPDLDEEPAPCDMEREGALGLPECPTTGQPLPGEPVSNPRCRDHGDVTRWLGTDPVTPLAISGEEGVFSAGQPCCAPWARRGARWHALDRVGRVVGLAEVTGGEGYDATACFELELTRVSGVDGAGVYASRAPRDDPRHEWHPNAEDHIRLRGFLEELDALVLEREVGEGRALPLADRSLFFTEQRREGRGTSAVRYAAVGGPYLVIGRRTAGQFVVSHLVVGLANEVSGAGAYRPLAALDMDNDGSIEIVYRWNEGPAWGMVVLGHDRTTDDWSGRAEDIGGGTI